MSEGIPPQMRKMALTVYGPSTLYGVGQGAMLPVIALSARHLGGSVAVAALMVTLINIGSLIFNVPSSIICERYGERHAILAAAVIGTLSAVACLVAQNLLVFGLGAFLLGVSGSVFLLARQSYLTQAVPPSYRARALSTLGGVNRVGMFFGPFIGAAVMHWWGLSGAYGVTAISLALAGLFGGRLEDLPPTPEVAQAVKEGRTGVGPVLRDYRRVFLTIGMGVLLVSAIRATRQAVIPLWAEHLGMSASTISVIYGISGAIDMCVFYPAGKVMDKYGRRWVTVPSMLVMAVAMMLMPATHGIAMLTLASCALGFGNGIGSGMVMTLGADYAPEIGRSSFLGIWRELSDAGATIGPAILSWVTALAGLGIGVIVSGGVGLAAAWVMWLAVPSKAQQEAAGITVARS